jgi:hypothetical protein
LEGDSGESATLVYEVTQDGGAWRWFTMFDPQFPITAQDAATKRIGDPLNLDGMDARVTLRDRSRVYHIEGQAPEGVDLGDVAEYFNAEAGKTMIVVSWTGDEVDCYHGITFNAGTVAQAFNLPVSNLSEFVPVSSGSSYSSSGSSHSSVTLAVVFAALGLVTCLAALPIFLPPSTAKIAKIAAPSSGLKVGSSGKIEGGHYIVVSEALVEIHEINRVVQRHEFRLRDENGNGALLIHGWQPGAKDWALFIPVDSSEPMTPQQAAALKCGKVVTVGETAAPVSNMFNSIAIKVDTQDILQSSTGHVFYGFTAASGTTTLLARWNEDAINLYKGHVVLGDLTAAFTPPAAR